uniref:Cell surface A33 antigen isoform X2 n=1 Tax=Geotrypetes seraphini TaxID=260995 RepID=A0A6P8R9V4_GEOSA|nr:cell surface A33 antigen isoform X2 [Geotrypetes seraphini]
MASCYSLPEMEQMLAAIFAIQVKTPPILEAERSQSATLNCNFETTVTERTAANIQWKKIRPSQEEVISHYFGAQPITTGENYNGRVEFVRNVDANDATITISQLTMNDNGTYQCELLIPQDRKGHTFSNTDLLILVAPSKPECAIVGSAEYGQDIQLTCASKEGSPVPAYTWESYTPQNQLRQLPLTAVREGGQLTLKNISADTTGFYICTATNKIAKDFCNITLTVMPPSMNFGLYAGIIGGAVAAIIVIGIIAYCCCCRSRDNKEDYEMGEREEDDTRYHTKPGDDDEEEEEDDDPHQRMKGPPMVPPKLKVVPYAKDY